jgi:alpha-ketoglutarate-dependent taurine dioxygenase
LHDRTEHEPQSRGRLAQEQGRAILYKHDSHIIFNFNRQALQGVPGIEPHNTQSSLTGPQLEALDAVEASARRVQFPLKVELGDITFVNNFTILHARERFQDSLSETRHLVRMWLKNSNLAYVLPPQLAELNERLFDESVKRNWNVLPKARLSFTFTERLAP